MSREGDLLHENEFAVDPSRLPQVSQRAHPQTELQAVMEAAPHVTPVRSVEETRVILDLVRDAFDRLCSDDALLLEAVIFERVSFRQLEVRMGLPKTSLHRLYAAAILELRAQLIEHPEIVDYLEGNNR